MWWKKGKNVVQDRDDADREDNNLWTPLLELLVEDAATKARGKVNEGREEHADAETAREE